MAKTLTGLSSDQLLARILDLVRRGNEVEAELLLYLGEVDALRLYLEKGYPSMFAWCQHVLHFAESVAYKRIQAARLSRQYPQLLESLRNGELHLTALTLLAPRLTESNCEELIRAAVHRSAEEIRRLLADREPKPAIAASVRRVPGPPKMAVSTVPPQATPAPQPPQPPARARTEPLGAQRYRVQFTADHETHSQLEELRALLRHQVPDGDVGKILSKAISVLLDHIRKRKFASSSNPSAPRLSASRGNARSRHIPAAIRRAVWQRDAGRCTFVSVSGRRCESKDFVEFDHVDAWVKTQSHSIDGITLRCRAHNQLRARLDFGEAHMSQFRGRAGFESSSP